MKLEFDKRLNLLVAVGITRSTAFGATGGVLGSLAPANRDHKSVRYKADMISKLGFYSQTAGEPHLVRE